MRLPVRRSVGMLALILAGLLPFARSAQNTRAPKAAPALTQSQALLEAWSEIGRKLTAMAEDFPEDKYDYRPAPTQRTFAEQLLHVAGSNDFLSDVADGKKPVDDEERAHYPGKASVVAYLKKSFEKGAAAIRANGESGMQTIVADPESGQRLPLGALAWGVVEHCGEHYGQLVVYYRASGLVPPESRPKK